MKNGTANRSKLKVMNINDRSKLKVMNVNRSRGKMVSIDLNRSKGAKLKKNK